MKAECLAAISTAAGLRGFQNKFKRCAVVSQNSMMRALDASEASLYVHVI